MKKSVMESVNSSSNVTTLINASWQLQMFITSSCLMIFSVILLNGYFAIITFKERTYRSNFVIYLLPINIGDLSLGFAAVWRGVAEVLGDQPCVSCFFQALLGFISVATSLAMLLLISVIQYISIAHPTTYKKIKGTRFAVISSCVVPVAIIIFNSSVFGFLYDNDGPIDMCIDIKLFRSNYKVLGLPNFAFLTITLIGITTFNGICILVLRNKARLIGIPRTNMKCSISNVDKMHEVCSRQPDMKIKQNRFFSRDRPNSEQLASYNASPVEGIQIAHERIDDIQRVTINTSEDGNVTSLFHTTGKDNFENSRNESNPLEALKTNRIRVVNDQSITILALSKKLQICSSKKKVNYLRSYITLTVMNVVAVVCMSPYIVRVISYLIYSSVPDSLVLFSDFAISANSAINPIIFLYRMPLYREHVKQNFRYICRLCKR